ncbi:probable RNA-directed DNA polymerase from transposon X-element [Trichonephila clavata]|uniref:Probable RNA-directed DNA polymerase from transposon X-element n=1 Tax=Trichonephila clavata TaxID=2740835 RepID=A0A8X6HLM1_TRICU|nr:probable RNA-directed DNA polymerase from transposon X-element [Trichonephila clavata]
MARQLLHVYLSLLRRWLKIWRIKINTGKSHAIVFRKGNYNNNMPPLKLFGRPIPWSTSVEYLGITLDRKLTFKNHLSKIKCKLKQRLAELRNLLYFKSTLSNQNKRRIFLQYLQPLLTYGCPIWGMAAQTHLRELQIIQNIALRLILNAPRDIPRKYIHADLKISPIHARIRELASSFFQNVPTHSNHTIAQAANITPGQHRHAAASTSIQDIF